MLQMQATKPLNKRERKAAQRALKSKQCDADITSHDHGTKMSESSVPPDVHAVGSKTQVMAILCWSTDSLFLQPS